MTVPSESRPIGRRRSQGRNLFYFRTSLEGWGSSSISRRPPTAGIVSLKMPVLCSLRALIFQPADFRDLNRAFGSRTVSEVTLKDRRNISVPTFTSVSQVIQISPGIFICRTIKRVPLKNQQRAREKM